MRLRPPPPVKAQGKFAKVKRRRSTRAGPIEEERRQDNAPSQLLAWSIARLTRRGGRVVVQVDGLVISPKLRRRRVLFFLVSSQQNAAAFTSGKVVSWMTQFLDLREGSAALVKR